MRELLLSVLVLIPNKCAKMGVVSSEIRCTRARRRREVRIMVKNGRGRAARDDGAAYNVEVPARQRGDYNLSPCPNHSSFWRGQFARP